MSRREDSAFDEARYSAFLQEAVNKVKTEEDPLVLNQMKKIFKKNVPFTLRGYVAAYVAKQAMGDFKGGNYFHSRSFNSARGTAKPGRKERFSPRTSEEETFTRSPRYISIDEEHAATLFVGIGRNRRVFPKDFITLLMTVCGLERDRIGTIRNQDNYSFIQVFKEDADTVIEKLNGYNYRGRVLTVSYARHRDDMEGSATTTTVTEEVPEQETVVAQGSEE